MKQTGLILGILFYSMSAFAGVQQAEMEFFNSEVTAKQTLFWGEILTLKQWETKPRSQWLRLDQHPQYTALANGHAERSYPALSENEMVKVLGDVLGKEFYASSSNKDEEYLQIQKAKDFRPQSALIFELKVAKTVNASVESIVNSMNNSVELLQNIDKPHHYVEISGEFAHRVMEPLHSGHDIIDRMNSGDKLVFNVIRMKDYNCGLMSDLLEFATEVLGESVAEVNGEPVVNIYSISKFSKVPDAELSRYAELVGVAPKVVFEQDMIYSSRFVKDIKNIWALIPVGDGQTQIVSYTVMAGTEKLKMAMSFALTGPSASVLGDLISNKTSEAAGEVVSAAEGVLDSVFGSDSAATPSQASSRFPMSMTADVVDLNADPSMFSCQAGLTKGIPSYVWGMFENLTSEF